MNQVSHLGGILLFPPATVNALKSKDFSRVVSEALVYHVPVDKHMNSQPLPAD